MKTILKRSQRLQTTRSTSKTHLKKEFSIKNLIHFWSYFDFEFFSKTILRNFDNDRSKLIMLKLIEEKFHTDDITKVSKKIFLSKQKKSTERITKLKNETKEVWSKTKKKEIFFQIERLFYISFSFSSRFIFAFIIYDLQHFSFMKHDRFRWISKRITQKTRFKFWIDRNDHFHDE
jgi:hypothetical protein